MVKRLLNPAALRRHGRKRAGERGFTLMELMIVMIIIGVLTAIAIPSYLASVRRAREAALREDLQTLRQAIESYTVDKEKAPQSLDDLVQAGYLKTVPTDPITSRSDTWIVSQSDTLNALTESDTGGISDVHSGAQNLASDGTSYNTW
jgi:general secretion pathway protein G